MVTYALTLDNTNINNTEQESEPQDRLIDWDLTALSAQIGYIVPLISMLHLKK